MKNFVLLISLTALVALSQQACIDENSDGVSDVSTVFVKELEAGGETILNGTFPGLTVYDPTYSGETLLGVHFIGTVEWPDYVDHGYLQFYFPLQYNQGIAWYYAQTQELSVEGFNFIAGESRVQNIDFDLRWLEQYAIAEGEITVPTESVEHNYWGLGEPNRPDFHDPNSDGIPDVNMGLLIEDFTNKIELKVTNMLVKALFEGYPKCLDVVEGCTDFFACNFDSSATIENNSCTYDCFGCTDDTASNFNDQASVDDGSCTYSETTTATTTTSTPTTTTSTPTTSDCSSCPLDNNNDGYVGVFDLLHLLSEWGAC